MKSLWIGKLFFAMLLSGFFCHDSLAQLATKSQEVWPSLDLYYKISPKSRLYGTISGTKLEESNYADGGVGIFFDYFTFPPKLANKFLPDRNDSLPGKFLWLRGGYQYGTSPPEAENPFKEHTIVSEVNTRSYLPYQVLLTLKNRVDWRVLDGEFQGRYRPRVMLERDLRTEYMYFTASAFVEYFAYFGNSSINRFRTQVGVEFRVTKFINYEVYWNHQFASGDEVAENDAFGMSLKVYLTRGVKVVNFKKKNQPKAGS
jgi:hypothetical protein